MLKNTLKLGNRTPIGRNSAAVHQQRFADGGPIRRPMEHTRSEWQDASTQPLTGSALKALVRGWMAGTAGLPGDLEGLARTLDKYTTLNPAMRELKNTAPVLPTSDFYKEYLPGKQQGDDVLSSIGSLFGGVGATKPVSLTKGALSRVAAAAPSPLAGSLAAQRGVIKAPGGNWLSGSVEDALKGLKREVFEKADLTDPVLWREAEMARENAPLNNWVDKQLRNYVRNDMATPNDPIRALAERGVLHYAPNIAPEAPEALRRLRVQQGFNHQGAGQSITARQWESLSDAGLASNPIDTIISPRQMESWMLTADPKTPLYKPRDSAFTRDLGFDHLMDELRNATNINSGLPAHLRLDPESLVRVSVPQAVERVAKINEWRAAQKVEADLARANNAATIPFKEYAENNPRSLRWVELKHSGDDAPFQDSVRYEGETMGHSVGGYANEGGYGVGGLQAARDGRVKLYSLRDAKGQPHVTVEVAPEGAVFSDVAKHIGAEKANELLDQGVTLSEMIKGIPGFRYPQVIKQIKGKGNRKPNDEYLPYVQDFVKSGKWGDVGDLQNTGLIRHSGKRAEALGSYSTEDELTRYLDQFPDNTPEFADGGSVRGLVNAAVGSSNLAKQVGSSADAARAIAAGKGSMRDLNSLRQLASSLGYTSRGLTQAMGLAGIAKAGYNMVKAPSAMNAVKVAATMSPIAAQALGLYNTAVNATPASALNFVAGFNPMVRAYNALADSFDFANVGRLAENADKIANPESPAELRDLFSNNPNSDSLARQANAVPGDSMEGLMSASGAFGTEPGYTGYYAGNGGSDTDGFPGYSGGDGLNGHSGDHDI